MHLPSQVVKGTDVLVAVVSRCRPIRRLGRAGENRDVTIRRATRVGSR
jgi:hypothetical protein